MIKAKHLARIHNKAHSTISTPIVHLSANEAPSRRSLALFTRWDWVAAGLLLAAVFFAGSYPVAIELDDNMQRILWVVFAATLVGLVLGASHFSGNQAALLGSAYGLMGVAWQLMEAFTRPGPLSGRLVSLLDQWVAGLQGVSQNGVTESSLLFISVLAVLYWGIGLNAGYAVMRQRDAWRALLPLAAVLLLFFAIANDKSTGQVDLVLFLLLGLLLVARAHYLDLRRRWEDTRTQTPAYIGADFFRSSVYISLGLLALAWLMPGLLRSVRSGELGWASLFGPFAVAGNAQAPGGTEGPDASLASTPRYAQNLALGRGNVLSDEVVLTVHPLSDLPPATRYYWRDRVYDFYDQGGWFSTFAQEELFTPTEDPLPYLELTGRRLERFEMTPAASLAQLHAPSEPVWLDSAALLQYAPNPDGSLDIQALVSPQTRAPQESYQVESWITLATAQQLAQAGSDYPEWIQQRYLQLPEDITQRTRSLAQQIAEDAQNPYEAALAVTQYLRDNITYQEVIDAPPANQESIDWLLFDYRRGFCNYYASAEVVLLRSLGIPARFAAGYAQGQAAIISAEERSRDLDINSETNGVDFYTVRQKDAHAWPEVYFPGIGWVEFEPTVSQQPLVRPAGVQDETPQEQAQNAQDANPTTSSNPLVILWLRLAASRWGSPLGLLTLAGLLAIPVAGVWLWRRYRRRGGAPIPVLLERRLEAYELRPPGLLRRWARYASLPALPRAYQEVNRALRWLGAPTSPGLAPAERAARLAERLPQLSEMITSLGGAYERALYSRQAEHVEGLARAQWSIRIAALLALLRRGGDWLQKAPQRWLEGRKPAA